MPPSSSLFNFAFGTASQVDNPPDIVRVVSVDDLAEEPLPNSRPRARKNSIDRKRAPRLSRSLEDLLAEQHAHTLGSFSGSPPHSVHSQLSMLPSTDQEHCPLEKPMVFSWKPDEALAETIPPPSFPILSSVNSLPKVVPKGVYIRHTADSNPSLIATDSSAAVQPSIAPPSNLLSPGITKPPSFLSSLGGGSKRNTRKARSQSTRSKEQPTPILSSTQPNTALSDQTSRTSTSSFVPSTPKGTFEVNPVVASPSSFQLDQETSWTVINEEFTEVNEPPGCGATDEKSVCGMPDRRVRDWRAEVGIRLGTWGVEDELSIYESVERTNTFVGKKGKNLGKPRSEGKKERKERIKREELEFDVDRPPSIKEMFKASLCEVLDGDGISHTFGDLIKDQNTIVAFIRHWFCPLCQDFMYHIVREADPKVIEQAGTKLIVIGNGSHSVIHAYQKKIFNSPFQIFTDPSLALYRALGMTRQTGDGGPDAEKGEYVKHGTLGGTLSVVKNLGKTGLEGFTVRPGHFNQLGGEMVVGPGLDVHYVHRMSTTRSHAPIGVAMSVAGAVPFLSGSSDPSDEAVAPNCSDKSTEASLNTDSPVIGILPVRPLHESPARPSKSPSRQLSKRTPILPLSVST